jgi:peptidase E
MVAQHIIAVGGGGFSKEADNLALERYILQQSGKTRPRVCFIPTASGDSDTYIRRFYDSFWTLACQPRHLSLFRLPTDDLQSFVMDHDVVYVGGGNTRNLLSLWRDRELDRILQAALQQGVVLAGSSAGSVCWFEQGVTDSNTPIGSSRLSSISCLGFLAGSNCPHYDSEINRRPEYHRLLGEGKIGDGWAVDDGVGLHFVNGKLEATISARCEAKAYRVARNGKGIDEDRIEPRILG